MFVSAIVVAAGKGKRLRSKISKPLVKLAGKPVIVYSLQALSLIPAVKEIIVVANAQNSKEITDRIRKYKIKKVETVVLGGERRQDSVYNGLAAAHPRADLILVHDAGRPFIGVKFILEAIKKANRFGAAVVGVPVKATIKKVNKNKIIEKTIDRKDLWEAQTPQVFQRKLLLRVFKQCGRSNVTDEAALVEKSGGKVAAVPGSYNNIKITTPEDLILAEAILRSKRV